MEAARRRDAKSFGRERRLMADRSIAFFGIFWSFLNGNGKK
jgi:hypothetical protein